MYARVSSTDVTQEIRVVEQRQHEWRVVGRQAAKREPRCFENWDRRHAEMQSNRDASGAEAVSVRIAETP
jgi:hypothetical protein